MADPDIDRIKAKFADAEAARKRERERAAEVARETENRQSVARATWPTVLTVLREVVEAMDRGFRDSGLSLRVETSRKRDDTHLDQVFVLLDGTPKEKRLVLNVYQDGVVNPIVLIPHSGRAVGPFSLSEATKERLREEIVNFLDQAAI